MLVVPVDVELHLTVAAAAARASRRPDIISGWTRPSSVLCSEESC
jgi:hypothetical protein